MITFEIPSYNNNNLTEKGILSSTLAVSQYFLSNQLTQNVAMILSFVL